MTGSRRASTSLAALALVVTVAGMALAAPSAEDLEDASQDVEDKTGAVEAVDAAEQEAAAGEEDASALDDVADSLAAIGDALGAAASATGQALASAGSAIASATAATGAALASAAQWTGAQIAAAAGAIASGTAWLAIETTQGLVAAVTAIGSGLAWAGTRLGQGTAWLGGALAQLAADVGSGLAASWPESSRGQAIAASTAGAGAAAGGAAWYTRAWRYLKYAPGLAPLYTRISRDELLDHPARQQIYERIEADPGVHLSELSRELDVSWGTLLHHLRKLEKAELVTSDKANGKRCFFLPGQVSESRQEILPALENEKARRIAEFYVENPSASQTEAADELGYSAALVSYHLQKLEDAGVVTREREGRRQRVGVTQEARAVVA
jgi:DNA-binding transcriptional ArsR family regulator